ncbi:S66 peptidase family protein [Pontibacter fetidus]|uniref:LD-carboxypeptidase n=1 Tax=Pontibacter fetidus TaxID=2700082 RepID=A0A6B2H073_9BACT|nr:LD-carboxypeptidase [Pontibacter fetidus]NDK55713.1 LD-carboxypeptidase [Pontibacter fetidus]
MVLPPFLQAGDKVGIVSTSNYTVQAYIDEFVRILKDWDLKPVLGKSIGPRKGSFAGSDALRKNDLQQMLDNDEIKAVFETMGGYGIMKVLEKVNFNKFKYAPKWIVGYSDTTFLHTHLQGILSTASIQGTMAADLEDGYKKASWESLRKALFGEKLSYTVKPHPLNRVGIAEAVLVGGTISVICNAKGTMSDVKTNGNILFLEEVGEHQYRLDSYLTSLKLAGKFEYLRGLIVGQLTDIKEDDPPLGKTSEQIFMDVLKDYDFPICFGFPAGHGNVNKALIFGATVQLTVTTKATTIEFKTQ